MADPAEHPVVPDRSAERPLSEEERQVLDALEKARQSVKAIVKREIEAESVSEQILNFRLG
jgi:2,3-bisphosphoglycerate-independent phosphoglycerate mutase